jgi:hypothetical protein
VKIFVSYSRRDRDLAEHLPEYFKGSDHDVFTDVDNITAGSVWSEIIQKNISDCDIFVILVTPAAVRRTPEIEKEILQAQSENKIIIPCIIQGLKLTLIPIKWDLSKLQAIEFKSEYDLAYNILSSCMTKVTILKVQDSMKRRSRVIIGF